MEYKVTVDSSRALSIIAVTGCYSLENCRCVFSGLATHPNWEKNFNILIDLRGADLGKLMPDELNEIVDFTFSIEEYFGGGRRAYILPFSGQIKVIILRWKLLLMKSTVERKTFQSHEYDKAVEWLSHKSAIMNIQTSGTCNE